ncbi:MAG: hypothetical protein J5978_07070 [Spirochaetaceae bacterium]|nr:hypothetical protein [Spirochaetaceae bacterium]
MKVEQIYSIVNDITNEITGKTDLVKEDLTNTIDVGKELFTVSDVDNYVKSLVNRIGKTIFVNREYSGKVPSVVMDSWEFGSVLQKISADMPQATENESWELENNTSYDPNIFYKPSVSAKFYNSKVTFEVPLSFTERQVKESFNSASELNAFISMLYNAVEKSMTVKIDSLVMRTINNMIAHTYNGDSTGVRAVNLLTAYNTAMGLSGANVLTADKAITDKEFLRFASMQIALYADRLGTMSTLFNGGSKERFTPKDLLHIVLLSDFAEGAKIYLESDTFNKELVKLPTAETVPYWQGSGTSFAFADVSRINVQIMDGNTKKDVSIGGILGVMFDRDSLGVCNLDRRVTTNYNPKAEFFSNWYKFDCGYFNDLNENFVFFYVADGE